MYDRLGVVIQALVALGAEKPPKLQPAPRPRTAINRARAEARFAQHRELVKRVLPGRDPHAPAGGEDDG